MSVPRLVVALALFAVLAVASVLGPGAELDRAITIWLQNAMPSAEAAHAAARLVFLGDAAILVPGVGAIGLVLLFVGDERRGAATLLLAAAVLGASLLAGFFEHVIVHPGPPEALKLHFPRPADAPLVSLVSVGNAAVIIAALAALRLVLLFVTDKRRSPASLGPAGAALGIGLVAVAIKHLMNGLPPALTETMNGYAAYGYPSGHIMRTALVAGTALRRLPALGAALVVAMMGSLVYLGDHWTSEVLGGLCLGWACVEVSREVWRRAAGIRWAHRR
jgi:membrane-associated phospholipid phosphatase